MILNRFEEMKKKNDNNNNNKIYIRSLTPCFICLSAESTFYLIKKILTKFRRALFFVWDKVCKIETYSFPMTTSGRNCTRKMYTLLSNEQPHRNTKNGKF